MSSLNALTGVVFRTCKEEPFANNCSCICCRVAIIKLTLLSFLFSSLSKISLSKTKTGSTGKSLFKAWYKAALSSNLISLLNQKILIFILLFIN